MSRSHLVRLATGAFVVVVLVLILMFPDRPALWWDEGWNLMVARNWAELGHYGRICDGQLIGSRLATGFPAVAPVALAFELLGVGIWQGRLVGLLFLLGSLTLLFFLGRSLYSPSIGMAAVVTSLLLAPEWRLQPLLGGRQVLGEMPAIFYLLVGYCLLFLGWRRHRWLIFPVPVFWGLAVCVKLQVLPFLAVSLAVSAMVAVSRKRLGTASLLTALLAGSLVSYWFFGLAQRAMQEGLVARSGLLSGLHGVTALVPTADARVTALATTLFGGIALVLGLIHVLRKRLALTDWDMSDPREVVRLSLLSLTSSWFLWYLLFSAGWPRYFLPALFLGSLFTAVWLSDSTDGFRFAAFFQDVLGRARTRQFNLRLLGTFAVLIWLAMASSSSARVLWSEHATDGGLTELVDFLDEIVPSDALVESYDIEWAFLVNRRHHYPPDQVHVAGIMRQTYPNENVEIDYDPLDADPDYLVNGPFGRAWELYDQVLEAGHFVLLGEFGELGGGRLGRRYQVYERKRE